MFCPLFEEEKDLVKRGGERQVEESMELCIVIVCVCILSARARTKVTQDDLWFASTKHVCLGYMWRSTHGIASLQSLPDDFERFVCILV